MCKQVIKNEMWRKRVVHQTRQPVEYKRFSDFVTAQPPEGLGTNMNVLMSICRFEDDMEAVDLLAKASTGKEGAPEGNKNAKTTDDNINSCLRERKSPTGTSTAATMRRLSKDFPSIHARVLTGELTPNQAALEAGFRQPKFQLPADPEAAGRYLAEHVDDEWLTACYNAYREAKW